MDKKKVLISSLYSFEPIIVSITKLGADILYLFLNKKPNKEQNSSLKLLQNSLGKAITIKTIKTGLYDIIDNAKTIIDLIDSLPSNYEIYIDITSGRKTKALGMLFGAYNRIDRIKKIVYVIEETKQLIELPKMTFGLNTTQKKFIELIKKHKKMSLDNYAKKLGLSKSMVYKLIKELKDKNIITEADNGFEITKYGRLMVL